MTTRLGVLGGTFDPPHLAHLVVGSEARHALALDGVLFVPVGDPWQKAGTEVSAAEHRFEMTRLATADNDTFEVSRVDIDRGGPTYAVDTLRDVSDKHPGAELFFLVGADAMLEILTWKEPHQALTLATFVAVTRPGADVTAIAQLDLPVDVPVVEVPSLALSSTDIRNRVRAGHPIRYLVPDAVEQYIYDRGLYRA